MLKRRMTRILGSSRPVSGRAPSAGPRALGGPRSARTLEGFVVRTLTTLAAGPGTGKTLVDLKLSDGSYLVARKTVTGFSNRE